jgi:glutamyl-tRNA synthetase
VKLDAKLFEQETVGRSGRQVMQLILWKLESLRQWEKDASPLHPGRGRVAGAEAA